ncbi:BTAD domain-containing putative transcriptional regulator [Lentzea sp. NPDC060358]|uniref:AfsR/SARP family transcriptional regulator n=1 Tax=Lentzea sp. NPDC060358 TaxID=3347103 RepID=UPI003662F8AD
MRSFGLLGPLDVVLDGRRVHVPPGKRRVVLAALLLRAGRVVGADELAELVGGSRHALQTTVGRLREDLGRAGLVLTRSGGYLLDVAAEEVDVHRFDLLPPREALRLWRGRPFADIGSDALERDHVPALTEKYLATLEARIEADLRDGAHERLVPELRSLTGQHPARERLWAQLVVALHRCDRQTEAVQVYEEVRATLADELGLDPGRDLQQAHRQVLTADHRPRPRNDLPGDIADFAGRGDDLGEILAAVPSGCVAITAIDGMAGIGKTTLAVRAAHRLAARFPDAQLFVDLHSHTAGVEPRTPSDALLALLTALGVPAHDVPDGLDARAARWRAEMAHRKALVVLDNAGSAAQVRPLLPGTGLVLVTSRRRLVDLDAAHTVSLDVLSEKDSLDLLASITRRNVDDCAEIVRLCGHLPLAVRIVGARWRTRPAWSAHDVARRLTAHRLTELAAGERSVAGAFSLSYRQLTADQQKLFRRLGVHTGEDWDAHLAAALIGSTRAEAERLLDELLDVHLVQQKDNGRYRLHDLLADHAKAEAGPQERDEAVVRLLDHYLRGAEDSARRIAPGRPKFPSAVTAEPLDPPVFAGPVEALAWQGAERRNLRAAVYLAAYEGHYRHAWQLPSHFAHYLWLSGAGRERVEVQNVALAAAHALGDLAARAEALRGLGSAYMDDGNPKAEEHLHEAIALLRQIGDVRGEASATGLLGMIARERHEYDASMEHFHRGLALMRQAGAPTGIANALHNIGINHAELGRTSEALAHMREAAALVEERGDVRELAVTLNNIAHAHFDAYQDDECLACMERSLAAYRECGDRRGEALALADFARWRYEMGHLDAAGALARDVARLCREYTALPDDEAVLAAMSEIRDHVGQMTLFVALSLDALTAGRPAEAIAYLERFQGLGNVRRWWSDERVLDQFAAAHLELGDRAAAVRYAQRAVAAAERGHQPRVLAVAQRTLARAKAPAPPV